MPTIVECPRDAMQGWKSLISTADKIRYLNALLKVGFHTLDFGSFVSPKAIPQMADTKEVVAHLDLSNTKTKLLAIVANERGAEDAANFTQIAYLGFPFSISETFQQRNTNASIAEAFKRLKHIHYISKQAKKELVVYISMGFGNPYGDAYNETIVFGWAKKIANEGVKIISLADTVGLATPQQVEKAIGFLTNELPEIEIGVHLHSDNLGWRPKLEAAYKAGCRRIDGAINGIGGCPMAKDDLVGNLATENIVDYLVSRSETLDLDIEQFDACKTIAKEIFI